MDWDFYIGKPGFRAVLFELVKFDACELPCHRRTSMVCCVEVIVT